MAAAAAAATAGPTGSSTFQTINEEHKRWLVFGIALNHVLVPSTRPFLEQEIQKEYNNLKASHKIHIQSTRSHLPKYPKFLKYENINNNDKKLLSPGKYDYSSFDWKVTSHVDFAKLPLENHMAKFNAFDEHCDASAVLRLLGKIPVFSKDVQDAANVVRQARNSWAHCTFTDWGEHDFEQRFIAMEDLTKKLGLASADESKILMNLNDWKTKGVLYAMNATDDSDMANLIQQHVNSLKDDVNKLVFDREEEEEAKKKMERSLEHMTEITCGSGKKQVRIRELRADYYEDICLDLNFKIPGKDYKTLAGKMGYTMRDVKKFELKENPADVLLSNWEAKSGNTVEKLIEILKSMENDAAAEKLEQALVDIYS